MTVKERGIIFSTDMVKAILEGKTQTRRTWGLDEINKHPEAWCDPKNIADNWWRFESVYDSGEFLVVKCPYGQVGDRLWVKETWRNLGNNEVSEPRPIYKADYLLNSNQFKWKSPRFMPRWASRIDLEITEVRAERLQEISEEDAEAEGFKYHIDEFQPGCSYIVTAKEKFEDKWDSLNAKRGYG